MINIKSKKRLLGQENIVNFMITGKIRRIFSKIIKKLEFFSSLTL